MSCPEIKLMKDEPELYDAINEILLRKTLSLAPQLGVNKKLLARAEAEFNVGSFQV